MVFVGHSMCTTCCSVSIGTSRSCCQACELLCSVCEQSVEGVQILKMVCNRICAASNMLRPSVTLFDVLSQA